MFYEACLAGGVSRSKAKMLYWAVANHGPQWRLVEEYPKMGAPGETGRSQPILVPRAIGSKFLTQADATWAIEFFANYDPPLDQIPGLAPPN